MSGYSFEKEARIRNYTRTLILIMLAALSEAPGIDETDRVFVEFTLGNGIFIRPYFKKKLTNALITKIWSRMHEIIEKDMPIEKVSAKVSDLYTLMRQENKNTEATFLHFRRTSRITLSKVGDYSTYFYGSLLRRTGSIKSFDIKPYENGFFLLLPDMDDPTRVADFVVDERLFEANADAYRVSHELGIDSVTALNKNICENKVTDLILTAESAFDRKLALTALDIQNRGLKFVLLAGPSSSGKTSTAYRLSYAMRTYGIVPHIISLDDYYLDRSDPDLSGKETDIESIEALDLQQFSEDMNSLAAGNEAEIPSFNFITKKREYHGNKIKLSDRDILIIEGIHSLNPRISEGIPGDLVYRVYISSLSHFNINPHNRIPSSDLRLLRRIVRDHRTRGYSARDTIAQWVHVRDGEEKNIFPFQNRANTVIDTAMVYELAAVKPFAERALFTVPRESAEYIKAKELLKFLDFSVSLPTDLIPPASIIREFIGGSCLDVK